MQVVPRWRCFNAQAFEIYLKFEAFPDALRVALRAGDRGLQQRAFATCSDFAVKQQLCYILARQVGLELPLHACHACGALMTVFTCPLIRVDHSE